MQTTALETSAEQIGHNRVKLRVEVPETALKPAFDAVYRRWAGQIKVPGFRKGKVPRQIIDTRVGAGTVREEALQDALPDLYRDALRAEGIEAIASPEIEVVEFAAGSPLVFEATIDTRPEVVLPDIGGLEVEAPESEVGEAEVDEQLERLRDRFAELETVGREARRGDYALIDLNGSVDGKPVEGASQPDFLYEVGSRSGPPSLDAELVGNRPGAIIKFRDKMAPGSGEPAGQDISFTVLLKEVKAKKLPALDDEFAKTVGEFDKLADLRADLRERLAEVKQGAMQEELRTRALAVLVDATDLESPERLVEDEFNHRLEHFEADLKKANLTMADYERETDSTELEIRSELRKQVARSVKAELVIEELSRRQEIDVTEEELAREISLAAAQIGREPQDVAKQLAQSGRVGSVAADIIRRKALDYVAENVNVIGGPQGKDENQ